PVTQVTSIGTKEPEGPSSGCDPNYSGCVPNASDVDCAGGSGNGPAYVEGPVEVIGSDIYRLDADHDGIGCEDG
ncbi:MAG: resuscitation-promoting factor RpfB, partial [Kribbellaceae bacterium]|nr:resuscitation-promoting factor RpfB [Kribbellaceae bacterium]